MNDHPISPAPLTWRFGCLLLLAGWMVFGVIPVASVFFVEWLDKNNFMPLALLLVAVATAASKCAPRERNKIRSFAELIFSLTWSSVFAAMLINQNLFALGKYSACAASTCARVQHLPPGADILFRVKG